MEGTKIGPFQIHEKLGHNNRHHVYRATQLEQGRDVALKFIQIPPDVPGGKVVQRIQQESRILKQLNHPNLVKVHGAGIEGGQIFFALELVEGETLAAILSRRSKLAWELAADYARQVACCLEYLHSQEMLHLKLTPDKIIISPDGQVRVSDLRLNRTDKKRWDATRNKSIDLAAYLPPELITGEGGTSKCDFYSLGVILFEMLTGKLPYTADSFASLSRIKSEKKAPLISEYTLECPMWMETIVESLLANDPNDRPFSARAIIIAIDEVKRADKEGTGVAEKMVSGFSPLTAGKDKTEAKKTLRIKKKKKKPQDEVPLLQSTPFLVTSFLLVVIALVTATFWISRPVPSDVLIEQAQKLADEDELTKAKKKLEQVVEREDESYDDAKLLLVDVMTERLLRKAESRSPFEDKYAKGAKRDFYRAYHHEEMDEFEQAVVAYQKIMDENEGDSIEEQYVYNASKQRIASIDEMKKQKQIASADVNQQNDPKSKGSKTDDKKTENDGKQDLEKGGDSTKANKKETS